MRIRKLTATGNISRTVLRMRNLRINRPSKKGLGADEGLMSVAAAIFVTAFMAVTVVLISQHQYLSALSEVREVSFNAARAASQKLAEDTQRDGNQPTIDLPQATQAAQTIIADVDGVTLQSVDVSGSSVTVVVSSTVDGALGSRTFSGTARAQAIDPNA